MFVDGACCVHCTHAVVRVSAGENENDKERPLIGLRLHHSVRETCGPQWAPRAACAVRPLHLPVAVHLSRPKPVHILGREAGSAAAAQPLPPLFYCCSRAGRYPRLGSRGGGKQQAVGLACSSCLLASFRSILAQIPRRFLGVHHLAGCSIILSLFWSVCCGRRGAICPDSKRY